MVHDRNNDCRYVAHRDSLADMLCALTANKLTIHAGLEALRCLWGRQREQQSRQLASRRPSVGRFSALRAAFHLHRRRVGSEQQEEPGVARYKSALLSMTTSKSAFVSALFHRYYLKWAPGRTPLFCNCGIRAKPCNFCGIQNTRPREFRPDQHIIQVRTRICPEPRTSETSCDAWSDVFGLMD